MIARRPSPVSAPIVHRRRAHDRPFKARGRHRRRGRTSLATADIDLADPLVARAALHVEARRVPPGVRTRLVDAVLDTPEVAARRHLQVALPLGDTEILQRVRERCDGMQARAAGVTCLVDADLRTAEQLADYLTGLTTTRTAASPAERRTAVAFAHRVVDDDHPELSPLRQKRGDPTPDTSSRGDTEVPDPRTLPDEGLG